jgi:hypothetical protein
MRTSSLWEQTLSFFPQFLAMLKEYASPGASVAVVGASDGKFVMPLAAAGYRVTAIECDPLALHGGEVRLPGDTTAQATGLIARLKAEDLHNQVQIVERDFLADGPCCGRCDAVWTSCSWHYSMNHHRPLPDFIARMKQLVRPGGLFGAEFMMPIEQRHFLTERAHVGQLHDHTHRMGLLVALREPTQITGE